MEYVRIGLVNQTPQGDWAIELSWVYFEQEEVTNSRPRQRQDLRM